MIFGRIPLYCAAVIPALLGGCALRESTSRAHAAPPDSVEFIPYGMPFSIHSMCSGGPSGSILVVTGGDVFRLSPPAWRPEKLRLELPINRRYDNTAAFYSQARECYYFLVGNGLFRLPRDSTEADSHLLITRPYSNLVSSHLLPIQGGRKLVTCCSRSALPGDYPTRLVLVDTGRFCPLDTLHHDSSIAQMVIDNEGAELYLRECDGDVVVIDVPSFSVVRVIEPEPDMQNLGQANDMLLGERHGSLYRIDALSGELTALWKRPENCGCHRYEWRFAYPWGPYAFRVDWRDSLLETVRLSDLSVIDRNAMDLSIIPDLTIYFDSPDEGFVFNKVFEGYYRLLRPRE